MMSSEGISSVSASDLEDLSKNSIKVEAEVHSNVQPDGGTTDARVNSNGIEIDSISSEDKVVFIPPSKQAFNETTGATSSASSNPAANLADKEKGNAFVVQMTPRKLSQHSLKKQTSMLLRRGSSRLSRKESWRTRASGTRIKNRKNYISFHNITYTVPQGWFFQKKPPKVILNDIRLVLSIQRTKTRVQGLIVQGMT